MINRNILIDAIGRLYVPLIISILFFVGSLVFLYNLPFQNVISFDIVLLSYLDYFLTILVLFVFLLINRNKFDYLNHLLAFRYKKTIEKLFIVFVLLCIYTIYNTYNNLFLVIVNGYNREGLLATVQSGYLDMLLPILFNVLFIISIIYKYPLRIKIVLFIGVVAIMLLFLSRSNILFLLLFSTMFLITKQININYKFILKFSVIIIVLMFGASYITILQGRGDSVLDVIGSITETLFRYKAYSFYLAEYAIEVSIGIEKSLFPFFGWFSEKILSFFTLVSNPIGIYGSEFVYEFHFLGDSYRANVLYPWWAWFYGYFGLLGLILKVIYIYLILTFLLRYNFVLTFLFFLYLVLFSIEIRHPFLNASNFYSIFSLILFDVISKFRFIRSRHEKNSNN